MHTLQLFHTDESALHGFIYDYCECCRHGSLGLSLNGGRRIIILSAMLEAQLAPANLNGKANGISLGLHYIIRTSCAEVVIPRS